MSIELPKIKGKTTKFSLGSTPQKDKHQASQEPSSPASGESNEATANPARQALEREGRWDGGVWLWIRRKTPRDQRFWSIFPLTNRLGTLF